MKNSLSTWQVLATYSGRELLMSQFYWCGNARIIGMRYIQHSLQHLRELIIKYNAALLNAISVSNVNHRKYKYHSLGFLFLSTPRIALHSIYKFYRIASNT